MRKEVGKGFRIGDTCTTMADSCQCMAKTLKYCKVISLISHASKEKAMASHSSTLAWKIPWTEEPGGLQSMGLLGVGHD